MLVTGQWRLASEEQCDLQTAAVTEQKVVTTMLDTTDLQLCPGNGLVIIIHLVLQQHQYRISSSTLRRLGANKDPATDSQDVLPPWYTVNIILYWALVYIIMRPGHAFHAFQQTSLQRLWSGARIESVVFILRRIVLLRCCRLRSCRWSRCC